MELSRKMEIPRPLSNTLVEMLFSLYVAECICYGKDCFQFVVGFVPGPEEVIVVHFFEIEFVELVDVVLKCFHINLLLL